MGGKQTKRGSIKPLIPKDCSTRTTNVDTANDRRESTIRLKCCYLDTKRVIHLDRSMTIQSLYSRLNESYGFPIGLSYNDEDGDDILLSTNLDLEELIAYCTQQSIQSVQLNVENKEIPLDTRHSSIESDDDEQYRQDAPAESEDRRIRWRRGELLGRGAFGKVFLALNLEDGNLIAVKQLEAKESNLKVIMSLEQEISLMKGLNHKHIVQYLGTERFDQTLSIFLEYLPGGSLAHLLTRFGALDESIVRGYTRQILLGLEYLHPNEIAHRDIKGGNILLDNSGCIKLSDFGGSVDLSDETQQNGAQISAMKGTPYWMAPEVVRQHATKNGWKKADIWSVGCTVIEMLTAKPPWSNFSNPVTALYQIACRRSPPAYPLDISDRCQSFLDECFQLEPSERPGASDLLTHEFIGYSQRSVEGSFHRVLPSTPRSVSSSTNSPRHAAFPRSINKTNEATADRISSLASSNFNAISDNLDDIESYVTKGALPLVDEKRVATKSTVDLVPNENETHWEDILNPLDFDPLSLVMHNYSKDAENYGVSTIELKNSLQSSWTGDGSPFTMHLIPRPRGPTSRNNKKRQRKRNQNHSQLNSTSTSYQSIVPSSSTSSSFLDGSSKELKKLQKDIHRLQLQRREEKEMGKAAKKIQKAYRKHREKQRQRHIQQQFYRSNVTRTAIHFSHS